MGTGSLGRLLLVLAVLSYLVVVLRNAWVSEDAYVTFRALDNLLEGRGLRWNQVDRVQTFSNPLWLFVLAPFVPLFSDPYLASLVLSVVLAAAAAVLLATRLASTRIVGLAGLTLLLSSRAYVDYSTSGLENPLSHFLVGAFLACYWKMPRSSARLLTLSALTALVSLNRLDCVLFCLPALLEAFVERPTRRGAFALALGFLPLILWELFSITYYGFFLPNTAYAKLNTGIPRGEVLFQGTLYVIDLISNDPLSFLAIGLSSCVPFFSAARRLAAPALGLGAYLAYIVWIGGDFMSGRFFSTPVFVAVALLVQLPLSTNTQGWGAVAVILGLGFIGPTPPFTSGQEAKTSRFGSSGVADERRFYFQGSGLLHMTRSGTFPNNSFLRDGLRDKKKSEAVPKPYLVSRPNVGFYGFAAGPRVHVIDILALGDPLLARLPAVFNPAWRVGHYDRVIPDGYAKSVKSGQAALVDPRLNEYLRHLKVVTQGPLFSAERFATILGFAWGKYDDLIDRQRYRYSDPKTDRAPLSWSHVSSPEPVAIADRAPVLGFSGHAFLIQSRTLLRSRSFSFGYASTQPSKLFFLHGMDIVGEVELPPLNEGERRAPTISVPPSARREGFDALFFRAEQGPSHEFFGIGRVAN